MNLKKIFAELKRRNVFKVATAYAITGWLIIQIVTAISEPLSLPLWFDAAIIIFVLIGFPVSLLFAWAFEMTPDGLKKTKHVEIQQSVTKSTGKKLNLVIIITLSLLVAFLLNDKFSNNQQPLVEIAKNTIPSIAVLPFADMSPKKDQEYFSDGLSEELLNVLAKVNNIKVAGRTSSFKFKGKNDDIKKIGKELGVEHVLEGSVRKSGNKLRITAQLIKVNDGFHLWSETYDEPYSADNIFDIQDKISKKVLKELKIKLSIKEDSTFHKTKLTTNTKAYEAYLKGNQLLINRKPKDIENAIIQFKLAITLDDQFAMAYARLATAYGHLFNYGNIKQEDAFRYMREHIDKALLIDNNLGSAYAALGHYYKDKNTIYNEDDNKNYKEAMKKAYQLAPNNPEVIMWYGNSLDADSDERVAMYLKALKIDPLAPVVLQNLANTTFFNKQYEEAEKYVKRNIEVNPEYTRARIFLIEMLTRAPNSKFGEGFIEAYKAYKKYPENLDVLTLLAMLSRELELHKVSEEMEKVLSKLYPENPAIINIKLNNLLYKGKFDEIFTYLSALFKKMNVKTGAIETLGLELFKNQISKAHPSKNFEYIKKFHPIYLSDTLTTLPDQLDNNLPNIIVAFQQFKQPIHNLINIYKSNTEKKYKHGGDITKEKIVVLNRIASIAVINGNAKLYNQITNEIYFNRKNKYFDLLQIELDPSFNPIRTTTEIVNIHQKIQKDKELMKSKAVNFLKNEGVWEQYKE
mgnify:FL=1